MLCGTNQDSELRELFREIDRSSSISTVRPPRRPKPHISHKHHLLHLPRCSANRGGNDILLEISLKNIRQTQQHDIVRHRQLQTFFGFLPSSSPHDSFLPPTFVVTKSRVWPKMKAREEDNSVTRLRKCEPVMHRSRLIDGPTLVSSSSECKSLKCLRSFDNMPVRQTKLLRVTSNIQQSEV